MLIDDNSVSLFVDDLSEVLWIDDNGLLLGGASSERTFVIHFV